MRASEIFLEGKKRHKRKKKTVLQRGIYGWVGYPLDGGGDGGDGGMSESVVPAMSSEEMVAYIGKHHGEALHSDYVNFLKRFSGFKLQQVPLASIKTDLPKLDANKVAQYSSLDPKAAPPIVIYKHDGGYLILDGYHRASAAKEQGASVITAYVGLHNDL